MNQGVCLSIFMVLLVVFLTQQRQKRAVIQKILKKKKGDIAMKELAQKFIGKECLIYTVSGHQIEGIIREIDGNAMLVEGKNATEAVNLDFVVRIRDYPRNKNGKKKSVVLD